MTYHIRSCCRSLSIAAGLAPRETVVHLRGLEKAVADPAIVHHRRGRAPLAMEARHRALRVALVVLVRAVGGALRQGLERLGDRRRRRRTKSRLRRLSRWLRRLNRLRRLRGGRGGLHLSGGRRHVDGRTSAGLAGTVGVGVWVVGLQAVEVVDELGRSV